ncbi:MAG: hypothetical protein DSM106950_34570 [Stigonema ocellatum SAG 48.90 = DSM 106950]|nr:hypothetical protein [Stigonema ocellatum SAG 48.90 = DSM 106950]
MIHTPTIHQILIGNDGALLPYLRHQLETEELLQFKAQLSFHVDESWTQVVEGNDSINAETTLFITIKLLIVVDTKTSPDDATLHALEFQQMLDAQLINWSQANKQLLKPISEIKGTLSNLEGIPYHGGYLPGFEIQRKFTVTYTAFQSV